MTGRVCFGRREDAVAKAKTVQVLICVNKAFRKDMPSCGRRGGVEFVDVVESAVDAARLDVCVGRINCFGRCWDGPNARVVGGRFFTGLSMERIPEFVDHLKARAELRSDEKEDDALLLYPGA